MASTNPPPVLNPLPLRLAHAAPRASSCLPPATAPGSAHPCRGSPAALTTRRGWLLMLAAAPWARGPPATAQDIPLFGLRRKVEAAEEILKEGIEAAEKGIETATEREIATAVGFGGLEQAGLVAGAEAVGVLVAASVVNSILRP